MSKSDNSTNLTQRISKLPFEQRDLTGEYVSSVRKEFKECLRKVIFDMAVQAYDGKTTDIAAITKQAQECRQQYFQAMKGATNINEDAIQELIRREHDRQIRFYKRLEEMRKQFEQLTGSWTRFRTWPLNISDVGCQWDTKLTIGCSISVGSTGFYAFPLVQARTHTYPVEDVLYVDKDCTIILTGLPAAAEPFQNAGVWCQQFAPSGANRIRNLRVDFPLASRAVTYADLLLLDSEQTLSSSELAALLEKYGVTAVVKADSKSGQAFIYTGVQDNPTHIELELLD